MFRGGINTGYSPSCISFILPSLITCRQVMLAYTLYISEDKGVAFGSLLETLKIPQKQRGVRISGLAQEPDLSGAWDLNAELLPFLISWLQTGFRMSAKCCLCVIGSRMEIVSKRTVGSPGRRGHPAPSGLHLPPPGRTESQPRSLLLFPAQSLHTLEFKTT